MSDSNPAISSCLAQSASSLFSSDSFIGLVGVGGDQRFEQLDTLVIFVLQRLAHFNPSSICQWDVSNLWLFMSDPVYHLKDAALSLDGNAGRVDILHGISLVVERGESLGLIGPSGSGKSSLLMLMGGLERATAGQVNALGHNLGSMNEDALSRFRRNHMGVVFQSFHLIPTMTALENVATPLELAGDRDAFKKANAELEVVGLAHRAEHYPAQMSGGEQQRVALARAAAPRPDILLADEPTGNLDGANGTAVMDLLFNLRDRHGATLVLVTHSTTLANRCDRVIRLSDGSIAPMERAAE